MQRYFSKFVYY